MRRREYMEDRRKGRCLGPAVGFYDRAGSARPGRQWGSIFVVSLRKAIFAAFALTLAAHGALAQDSIRPQIDAAQKTLEDVDASLKSEGLDDADLRRLRAENDPVAADLRALVVKVAPQLDAAQKRLVELTPKPGGGDVTDAARADLDAAKQKFDGLDADVRSARALIVQADDNDSRIAGRRRTLFARRTFAQSSSLLSPSLWISAAADAPGALSASGTMFHDWGARLSLRQILEFLGVLAGVLLCAAPVGYAARNVIARDAALADPSHLHRALAAVASALVLAVLPLVGLGALSFALDAFDISDPRLQPFTDALFDGLRIVAVANALAWATLAPGLPQWRLFAIPEETARSAFRAWVGGAALVSAAKLLEPIGDSVSSLNMVIALRALTSAGIAFGLIAMLWRDVETRRPGAQDDLRATLRYAGWFAAAALLLAVLFGFVAFATFAVNQALFVAGVISTLFLFDSVVQSAGDAFVARQTSARRQARRDGGALAQLVVLAQGTLRLATVAFGTLLILAPWGIQSQDMVSTLREAYSGVQIGGVALSLSSIVWAIAVFAVAVFVSRSVQNWLGARLLPQTRMDAGLRNSIRTVVGYLGFVVALALAGGQLGLDLQKVTIVAGALSVGIGFGLQAIVNNFVSGLILLVERAVRVGDWVVIGAEQGFVRKISARATVIETVDRATLIVPNSILVSNAVKNWMYADRVARIVVSANVAYETDEEAARELLISAAKAQDLVMAIPAPYVLFNDFADWSLKFQLICYVDDVLLAERVRSELNFDVLRRMKEAGFRIPYPK